jgi:hypothetical protein
LAWPAMVELTQNQNHKHLKPSNNTGDDRLSKSLRKWNC